jgi:hypothetical protein
LSGRCGSLQHHQTGSLAEQNPLRRRSNGRTSSRVRARRQLKPNMTQRHKISTPPASTADAAPARRRLAPIPKLVAPETHAVDRVITGPVALSQ